MNLVGMWEEEADRLAQESLLSRLLHLASSLPAAPDKGPSVCEALGKQQAFSLSSLWSAWAMTPPCPFRRAWHTLHCRTSAFQMIQKQRLAKLM